eukprot:g3717.t1
MLDYDYTVSLDNLGAELRKILPARQATAHLGSELFGRRLEALSFAICCDEPVPETNRPRMNEPLAAEDDENFLPLIDLSHVLRTQEQKDNATPGQLANHDRAVQDMRRAMEGTGFCRVTGYAYDEKLWERMWALGKQIFKWADKAEFLTLKNSEAGFPYGLATSMKKEESNLTFDYYSDGGIDKPRLLPTGQDLNEEKGEGRRLWKDAVETDFPHKVSDGKKYDAEQKMQKSSSKWWNKLKFCKCRCRNRSKEQDTCSAAPDHSLYQVSDLNAYYSEFAEIAFTVLQLLREGLRVPAELDLEELRSTHWSVMRFLDYPSVERKALPVYGEEDASLAGKLRPRIPAHEDFGLITILRQDEAGGLQVLNKQKTLAKNVPEADWKKHGMYETVPGKAKAKQLKVTTSSSSSSNEQDPSFCSVCGVSDEQRSVKITEEQEPLIVNIGRVWDAYTNDNVKATTHKVEPVFKTGPDGEEWTTERNSHAFFLNPNWVSCFFGPLPQYGGKKEDWINFGMHINNCIQASSRPAHT